MSLSIDVFLYYKSLFYRKIWTDRAGSCTEASFDPVVKLLSKRWWIPTGARLDGPKLEPKGPRAEMGFRTADQGFSSIQGTLFGFYGI